MAFTELTVSIKGTTEGGEDSSYKQKFLLHAEFVWSENDETIAECVKQAKANSKIIVEDIKVRAVIEYK